MKTSFASRVRLYRSALIAMLLAGIVVQSEAQIYTLSTSPDGINSSSATVDFTSGSGYVSSWQVNLVNMLSQQVFYYSVGNNLATSMSSMTLSSYSQTLGGAVKATFIDTVNGVSITPTFTLLSGVNGDGSTYYTLGESIQVKNTSASTQTINFFQFSHFGLGYSGTQTVNMSTLNAGTQFEADQQTDEGMYPYLQDEYQIVSFGVTTTMYADSSGAPFGPFAGGTFNGNNGSLSATGNVDYGFISSASLAHNGSFTVSESQLIAVPEPSALALMSSGILSLALTFQRRRNKKA